MSACLPTLRPIFTQMASDSRLRSLQAKISGSWSALRFSDHHSTQKHEVDSTDGFQEALVHDGKKEGFESYDVRAEALKISSFPEPADGIVVRSDVLQNHSPV